MCITAFPQLISVAWYNLHMAWQLSLPKRFSVAAACGIYIYIYTYIYSIYCRDAGEV